MIERDKLARRWVHSHEEDRADEMVFRPHDYGFPPSRGRAVLDLHADGTCAEGLPGPSDVPEEAAGRWQLHGDRLTLRTRQGESGRSLRVLQVDGERLVVRR